MNSYEGSENAGVTGYELRKDGIILQFKEGKTYFYSHKRPGQFHVDNMKNLALAGTGLTTYVNKYVREDYDDYDDPIH
jgi:hypothetical protein